MATITFKFELNERVRIPDFSIVGIVRNASYGRGGVIGYWVEHVTGDTKVQEVFVEESGLQKF